MKKIAAINDLSGFGRCSLGVAMPIISAFGIECCPLPTGLYSNQTGYESFRSLDCTSFMQEAIKEWKKQGTQFDGILTGFIMNEKQCEIIENFITDFSKENTCVIVDPIMGDHGEIYPGFTSDTVEGIKRLSEKADIITPNLTELCLLTDENFKEITALNDEEKEEKVFYLSQKLNETKGKIVVTTGIHLKSGEIANSVYEKGEFTLIRGENFGGSFSGTGDIISSFIASGCVLGKSIKEALEKATGFINKAIVDTLKEEGAKPYHKSGINFQKFLGEIQ